jgi:hypothetical protein
MALDQIPALSQRALTKSAPQSKAEVTKATRIAEKILSSYPDYGKAPDGYLLSVTEFIAYQIPEVQEALAHPLTGIATKCKYLPTIADLREFIEERAKRLNTRATGYRYFRPSEDDSVDVSPAERRKAQVLSELGYDPSKPRDEKRRPIDPAIRDAIEGDRWTINQLKTPATPASIELLQVLAEQGYPGPLEARLVRDNRTSEAAA